MKSKMKSLEELIKLAEMAAKEIMFKKGWDSLDKKTSVLDWMHTNGHWHPDEDVDEHEYRLMCSIVWYKKKDKGHKTSNHDGVE